MFGSRKIFQFLNNRQRCKKPYRRLKVQPIDTRLDFSFELIKEKDFDRECVFLLKPLDYLKLFERYSNTHISSSLIGEFMLGAAFCFSFLKKQGLCQNISKPHSILTHKMHIISRLSHCGHTPLIKATKGTFLYNKYITL